jgi:uncharacterized lipoprotein YddW (UPF0748 family)
MLHAVLRRAIAAIAALLMLIISPVHAQDEVRALWVVRTTLTSPSAIATMVAAAKSGGSNTLLVQVRGRAALPVPGRPRRISVLTSDVRLQT